MAAVAGLRGTGDWATDERPKNFREMILFRSPNGTAPIFGLMSKVQKDSTDDPEFSWWDEPNDLVRLTVNGALGSGDTTVVIDSADPSTSAPGNVWGVAKHLKAGDLLLVEPTADAAAFTHEYLEVTSVLSDTAFMVSRGAAGSTAGAIANDASLLLVGSVYAEGTGAPRAASRNPIKYSNYTQIFKDVYEITGTAEETRTRTGDPIKNDKKRKAFDHARGIELALLFGRKSETTGDNGKPKRTFDGIRRFIPTQNTTIMAGADTLNHFLDAVYPIFDFDTEAGDTRIGFCGNGALNGLNKAIMSASGQSAINVNFQGQVKVYGMNFNEYVLPQGRLLLKTHPLMNRHALYKNSMFMIDFSALRWRPMKNRDTKFKDNIQNPDEDVRRGQWMTEGGIEVRYGGLTCGYIGDMHNLAP
jgi:hypothetical protein